VKFKYCHLKNKISFTPNSGFTIARFSMPNQNSEQITRDYIDKQLMACGWVIQEIKQVNLHVGIGVAVKEKRLDNWEVYSLC